MVVCSNAVFCSWPADSLCSVSDARLETMNFELLRLGQARLREPLANVLALVALQLQHLAVLRMLHHSAVARKFLEIAKYMIV